MSLSNNNLKKDQIKTTKELSHIVRYLYESFEMLSRWTPEFTAKEFLIILALRENQPLRISDLVIRTGFSYSTVSWLVDSLVNKKVVVRRRNSSDRRVVMVRLTVQGQEAIKEYDSIFDRIADLFYGSLTADEQNEYLILSRKVVNGLEEKSKGIQAKLEVT
jgi:DNA-binding MarR family transcriptional regulator